MDTTLGLHPVVQGLQNVLFDYIDRMFHPIKIPLFCSNDKIHMIHRALFSTP